MIRVLGLGLYGPRAASTRHRLEQYKPGLADCGIELQVNYLLGDDYLARRFQGLSPSLRGLFRSGRQRLAQLGRQADFDLAIVYCELFPLLPWWIERLLLSIPYICDFDDAFYLKYRTGNKRFLGPLLGKKFHATVANAAAVTAGNTTLTTYARARNENVELLPTVIDTEHLVPVHRESNGEFTVGWIGSPSTSPYLELLRKPLAQLGREAPLKLVVVGGRAPSIPGVTVEEVPWSSESELEHINRFDVGVMPLPEDDWARGKCAFKLIQYMACARPVIGTGIGANTEVVGADCGFLARTDEDWLQALRLLRDQPELRERMGLAGRQRVEQHYSLRRNLPLLADVIRRTVARAR